MGRKRKIPEVLNCDNFVPTSLIPVEHPLKTCGLCRDHQICTQPQKRDPNDNGTRTYGPLQFDTARILRADSKKIPDL